MNTFSLTKEKKIIGNDLPTLHIYTLFEFLGICIGENVAWEYHVEYVCNKVSRNIGIMNKSRNILIKQLMKQLHFSINSWLFKLCKWCLTSTN